MSADGLAEWYAARLDEAEAKARAAKPGPWRPDHNFQRGWRVTEDRPPTEATLVAWSPGPFDSARLDQSRATAAFIAAHDPAWRLRDIAAKRAVLAAHPRTETMFAECGTCRESEEGWAATVPVQWPCPTVRHLAAEFAGQPGYRPEWRPET